MPIMHAINTVTMMLAHSHGIYGLMVLNLLDVTFHANTADAAYWVEAGIDGDKDALALVLGEVRAQGFELLPESECAPELDEEQGRVRIYLVPKEQRSRLSAVG